MDAIFLIVILIISAFVADRISPSKAFLNVYLFVLLLTPSGDSVKFIEFIPALTIGQAALFPVFAFTLLYQNKTYRYTLTDFWVLGFILTAFISEILNDGYLIAQNNTYYDICTIALPYLTAKMLIENNRLDFKLSQRFVLLMTICSLTMLYEFITGKNYFIQIFWQIFHMSLGVSVSRYDFMRATGPFSHPITACIIVIIALFLYGWLLLNNQEIVKRIKIPYSKYIVFFILLCGVITPISRGPIVGGLCGLFIFSFAVKKKYMFMLRLAVISMAVFTVLYIYNINDTVQNSSDTELSGSVYYRSRLIDVYWDQFINSPYFGTGKFGIVLDDFYYSIDNAYLYIAVNNGIFNLACFGLIILTLSFKLIGRLRRNLPHPEFQLVLMFLSLITMFCISFGTVWIAGDMSAILFLIFGWMEGYLCAKKKPHLQNLNVN